MITQIKPQKKKVSEDNVITLEIHPEIQVKLRINRRLPFRSGAHSNSEKDKEKSRSRLELTHNLESIESDSPKRMSQINSIFPMEARRTLKPRMSSYQLYKQDQRQSRVMQRQRSNDWKMRLWSKRSEYRSREQPKSFIRSKSLMEHPRKIDNVKQRLVNTINSFKLMNISKTVSNSPRSRSMYIKTNDGKRKMIDNKKHLQKMKQNLEANPLSAILNSEAEISTFGPSVLTLSPRNKEKDFKRNDRKGLSEVIKNRCNGHKQSRFEFSELACRPWSGNKMDFGTDLHIFLNNN